jgi:hypothetical protein
MSWDLAGKPLKVLDVSRAKAREDSTLLLTSKRSIEYESPHGRLW